MPVGEAAILRAIELNGAAVALNRRAFLWGRILAERPALEDEILVHTLEAPPATLDALIEARAAALVAYQNAALANRYRALVNEVIARETQVLGEPGRLSRAAAEGLYRVMAYKDEYEVARLHAAATYGEKPVFHLSPPLITGIDPATGRRRKIALPGWLALPLFRVLRHGKRLRGTRARSVRPPAGAAAGAGTDRAVYRRSARGAGGAAAGYAGCRGGDRAVARHDPRLRAGEGREPGEGGGAAPRAAAAPDGCGGGGTGGSLTCALTVSAACPAGQAVILCRRGRRSRSCGVASRRAGKLPLKFGQGGMARRPPRLGG